MKYPRRQFPKKEDKRYTFGRFIRDTQVYCIDHNNNNLGLINTIDALQLAKEAGLELVQVSPSKDNKAPVCKILDLGKFKYEQEKREKVLKKKQRENAVKIKEVKLRPVTDNNDLQIKARQLQEFIDEGNRIKVIVTFRGREMAHKEIGLEIISKFSELVTGQFMSEPVSAGRNISVIIAKKDTK